MHALLPSRPIGYVNVKMFVKHMKHTLLELSVSNLNKRALVIPIWLYINMALALHRNRKYKLKITNTIVVSYS